MAPSQSALADQVVSNIDSSSPVPSLQLFTEVLDAATEMAPTGSPEQEDRIVDQDFSGSEVLDLSDGEDNATSSNPLAASGGLNSELGTQDSGLLNPAGEQTDPLDSPYPVPWNWVMTTQAEVSARGSSGVRYYRSPLLVSPDGEYAAYSRIEMQVEPDLYRSRVSSVMFLENLKTRELRTITASSPLATNAFSRNQEANMPGAIAILMPVSWSSVGDRILARQFEGLFSTSDASDYAVVWDRAMNQTTTIAPTPSKNDYSTAILLGWSQTNPDQVLFRAGNLGDDQWPLWAVNTQGQTVAASEDQPLIFGQLVNQVWAGPQAHW